MILGNTAFYMVTRGYLLQHEATRQTKLSPLLQFVASLQKETGGRGEEMSVLKQSSFSFLTGSCLQCFLQCVLVFGIYFAL